MERAAEGKQLLRVCIVLDDMVGGGSSSKSRSTTLERLMLTCRHEYNCTVVQLQQSLKSISPTQRGNTQLWALYPIATDEVSKVAIEHACHVESDTFKRMLASVHSTPHQFMLVDYRAPEERRFRHGFSRILKPADYLKPLEDAPAPAPEEARRKGKKRGKLGFVGPALPTRSVRHSWLQLRCECHANGGAQRL